MGTQGSAGDSPNALPDAHPDVSALQLGERLRTLRKGLGWTLQDLAKRSGVSLSTLSKIENAQVAPTFDSLLKAARGLGISFETLLAQASSEPPSPRRPAGGRAPDGHPKGRRGRLLDLDVRVSRPCQRA